MSDSFFNWTSRRNAHDRPFPRFRRHRSRWGKSADFFGPIKFELPEQEFSQKTTFSPPTLSVLTGGKDPAVELLHHDLGK